MPQKLHGHAKGANACLTANLARVTIVSVDPRFPLEVEAQFNPSQIQLEDSASWSAGKESKGDVPALEFTGNASRTLSVELFFDGLEEQRDVQKEFVEPLVSLSRVMDPREKYDEEVMRPPLVAFAWGPVMPTFRGVIQSVSTKLTMFLADGTPVRATCALKLMEASVESFQKRPQNRVAPPPAAARR